MQRRGLHDFEVRRKLAVHHDIDLRPGIGRKDRGAGHQQGLGQDEYIRRNAAIDVHFCGTSSIRFDFDEHGREHARNARRCGQNVAEQIERPRVAAGSNLAHIPDRGALCIEIGRHDIEATSRPVLSRDRREHGGVHMSRDQVSQGFRLEKTRAE